MALVEVPDRRGEAQRADRPDAADAQDELLVQPHLATTDVQDVGDRPVLDRVLRRRRCRAGGPARGPTCASQTAIDQVPPGQLDGDGRAAGRSRPGRGRAAGGSGRSRGSCAPGGRRRRSTGGSSPCDRAARRRRTAGPCRWPTSCGRRRGRPGRPNRCRATRGCRTRRRSRRSARRAGRRTCAGTSGPQPSAM